MTDLDEIEPGGPVVTVTGDSDETVPAPSHRILGMPTVNLAIWVIAICGVAIRVWFIVGLRFMEEDSLITLRYSRNLWIHGELTYNLGERVIGFTSPLWTLILAPVGGPFGFATSQVLITSLSLVLFAVAFYLAIRICDEFDFTPAAKIFVALALAIHASISAESVSGMEMSLYLLLVLGSALAAIRDRRVLAFALASLAVLTRPEGAIWWIGLFILLWLTSRRRLLRSAVPVSVAIAAPWLIFATLYYGTFIPQSALSKTEWLAGGESLLSALWRPGQLFAIGLLMSGSALWSLPAIVQAAALAASMALWAWGLTIAFRKKHHVIVLFGAYWVAIVLFYYLGRGLVFPWYAFVPNVFFIIVAAEVLNEATALVHGARQRAKSTGRRRAVTIAAVVTSVVAILGLVGVMAIKTTSWADVRSYEEVVLSGAGKYLAACAPPGSTLMLEPLGYVGYFSQLEVYDLAGLVSPDFAPTEAKFKAGWGAEQVRKYRPDYVVLRNYEIPENKFYASFDAPMFADPSELQWFNGNYMQQASFGEGSLGLIVFSRSDMTRACNLT